MKRRPPPLPRPSAALKGILVLVLPGLLLAGWVLWRAAASAPLDVEVEVAADGFRPERIEVSAGRRLHLHFRRAPGGCSAGLRVPFAHPVHPAWKSDGSAMTSVPPLAEGSYLFTCRWNRLRGELIVSR